MQDKVFNMVKLIWIHFTRKLLSVTCEGFKAPLILALWADYDSINKSKEPVRVFPTKRPQGVSGSGLFAQVENKRSEKTETENQFKKSNDILKLR